MENPDPLRENAVARNEELEQIKRSLSPADTQRISKNKLKKLKRNPHKNVWRSVRFPLCECGNPKVSSCVRSRLKVHS